MNFKNIRGGERSLRLVAGAAMLAIGWMAEVGPMSLPFRVLALYPLITGLAGWCPVYALLRIDGKR